MSPLLWLVLVGFATPLPDASALYEWVYGTAAVFVEVGAPGADAGTGGGGGGTNAWEPLQDDTVAT